MHDSKTQPDGGQQPVGGKKRVTVRRQNGLTIYSASAWPGWRDISNSFMGFVIIAVVLVPIFLVLRQIGLFIDDVVTNSWLNRVVFFVITGLVDLSIATPFVILLLWLPYFLVYQLSAKEFWIENETLCHTVRFLGIISRTRRIHFDRIMKIEIAPSGSIYHLKVVYEMRLPRLLYIILVYWNEKFTRWPWSSSMPSPPNRRPSGCRTNSPNK